MLLKLRSFSTRLINVIIVIIVVITNEGARTNRDGTPEERERPGFSIMHFPNVENA
jgi:hypothetical protein